ncbi:SHOCT domain-containing protein [Salinigranum sp. GCM10025319]|uniref:SHOCT domain-containing protein n=1 Tax=Salinigranum sp. GCM10025319 TaxID=3252687 RepID=UPI00360B732A
MRFIREQVEAANRPQQVQATDEPDPTDQLVKVKELHDQGLLTDDEFEEKRRALVDEI